MAGLRAGATRGTQHGEEGGQLLIGGGGREDGEVVAMALAWSCWCRGCRNGDGWPMGGDAAVDLDVTRAWCCRAVGISANGGRWG